MMRGLAAKPGWVVRHGAPGKLMPFTRTQLSQKPDVIHLDWIHGYLRRASPLAQRIQRALFAVDVAVARALGARFAWTLHNVRPHGAERRDPLRRRFARACVWLRVFAQSTVAQAASHFDLPPERFRVVPEGSYVGAYPAARPRQTPLTESEADAHRTLLYVGLVKPYKGVVELIQAFTTIAEARGWRLLIRGAAKDAGYARAVRERCARHPDVTFVEGFVDVDDLPDVFAEADLVAAPFRRIDNSGSVIMAMGYAKPVVAPAAGSVAERLRQQRELLFALGDDASMREVLAKALTLDTDALDALGKANRLALEQHRWEDFAEVFEA